MARKQLKTLGDLVDYDRGRVRLAVERAIEDITRDLADRPTVDKARSLEIKLEFKPVVREGMGTLAYAEFRCHLALKMPGKRTATQALKLTDAGLEYDDLIRDDPDQQPLPFSEEKKEGRAGKKGKAERNDQTDGAGG